MKNIYYSLKNLISYNALFNFVVGNRGGGKTFASKEKVISHFLKTGEQFIYLRRYKTEIKKAKTSFFNDIAYKFENVKFKTTGNVIYINDEVAGYFISLSNAKIEKSVPYPKVKFIIYDEFILDKGHHYYLPDEVTTFLEFYETVARLRDVYVIFISNAISINNPYFLYFNIDVPYKKSFSKFYNNNGKFESVNKYKKANPDILVEFYKNDEFIEIKNKTRFGELIKDTNYSNYAINNEMLRDKNDFIQKLPKSKYVFTLNLEDIDIGVWYDEGNIFISKDVGINTNKFIFNNHKENYLILDKKNYLYKMLKNSFNRGNLFFENQKVKNLVLKIL